MPAKEGNAMKPMRAAILILSDKAFSGEREDKSGPVLEALLQGKAEVTGITVLPDERAKISAALRELADNGVDIVFTSGGTGFAPRDVTPEATLDVIDRLAPGIPEAMRFHSMQITGKAMLSRATAGIRGRTLIVNLPGSPKAVAECMEVLLPVMEHAVDTLRGDTFECGRK